MTTAETPLTASRRRDVDRRRARVRKAIADMHGDGSHITIASTAARAGVHRSFIHRHPDLHAAVLTAAAEAIETPSPAATAISHRSVLAENANLHALNRRLSQRVQDLEDRLSEMLGQQAFERSGLGAPMPTAALQADLEHHRQLVIDLTARIEELDEELAAAREANRGLMGELSTLICNTTGQSDRLHSSRPR
jgi:cell division protein FtsB